MKHDINLNLVFSSLALTILFVGPFGVQRVNGQNEPPQDVQGTRGEDDPIQRLNLTPEQREQIRLLRSKDQAERSSINLRLRDARLTLQEALDVENPDEMKIEPLLSEIGMLQAQQMRLRVLSELRIRRVLTAEQRLLLRELRLSRQHRRQENRRENRRGLRNERNGLRQVSPRLRP